jgi:hypothetical protein
VPDTGGVRQFEGLLRWPHWTQAERAKLLARLAEAERATTRSVLDRWPKEPPNRDPVVGAKDAGRAAANAVRDLRRTVTLLRIVEGPDAGDLRAELDRLGPNPAAPAVAELARKVRAAARRKLAESYAAADPARQALVGWAVDSDDVPAYPQSGTPGTPNPEPAELRRAEAAFHEWLATYRYTADATLYGASDEKARQDAAAASRDVAQAYRDFYR